MEGKCKKYGWPGMGCQVGAWGAALTESTGLATATCHSAVEPASPPSIAFGGVPLPQAHADSRVPIPGYDAPALPIKPMRDPSLSLIALSGVDPREPVMVAVPPVQDNCTFTTVHGLSGKRIGFADCYGSGPDQTSIAHRALFMRALETLCRAGVKLVPVPARRVDASLQFNLHTHNEIDELVNEYRLDALVSDSQSAAFHEACWAGYPRFGEPLEGGTTLWFYGARWSRESLAVVVQGYRSVRLNNPTPDPGH